MTESASDLVSSCVQRAQEAARRGTLLRLPFETLFEYLKVCCHQPASLCCHRDPSVVIKLSEQCKGLVLPCVETAHPGTLRSAEHCASLNNPNCKQEAAQERMSKSASCPMPGLTCWCIMQSLRVIAEQLRPLGRRAAFYLAAAVSDFYIPWPQMVRLSYSV